MNDLYLGHIFIVFNIHFFRCYGNENIRLICYHFRNICKLFSCLYVPNFEYNCLWTPFIYENDKISHIFLDKFKSSPIPGIFHEISTVFHVTQVKFFFFTECKTTIGIGKYNEILIFSKR